jgi:recombination protein RecT
MPNSELAKRPLVQLIQDSAAEFAKRLPATVDATRWAMQLATAVQRNADLLECDPRSLLLAAYEAAELGVSLSPTLQLGYLIPYKGKVQFHISWRGLVQKAYESGCVKAFFAEVVYANDKFERQYAPKRNLFHAPADGDRGEPIGSYALVEFLSGAIDWEYCDKALIERHRKHSKQPDSLMWTQFHEEAWRKTPTRILAKRLPLTNPGMEALAEAVARDKETEIEPEERPMGRLEFEEVAPVSAEKPANFEDMRAIPEKKAREIGSQRQPEAVTEMFFEVGTETTTVSGKTVHLRDELPRIGAKWDGNARVWRMPAARTDELVKACEGKQIRAVEVGAEKRNESQSEM